MKLFFVGACAMLLYIPAAIAQHDPVVPTAAKDAFAKQYPDVQKVNWEKEGANYEAGFLYHGHKVSVVYTTNGQLVETETAIAISELPVAAKQYAQKKGTITEAARIIKADGSTIYEAEVNHVDLLFDNKGNFTSEHKD